MNNSAIEAHTSEIEAALTSHPCVEDALAFTVTPSTGRKQSGCLVTLKSGKPAGKQALKSHAAHALGPSVLHEVIVVSEIPRDEKGRAITSRVQGLIKHHLDGRRRQPSLSFAVAFTLPANVNPALLDPWLNDVLLNDLDPDEGAGSNERLELNWLWRCLALTRLLMQACRLPVFDKPRILRCEATPRKPGQYTASVTLPQINSIPPDLTLGKAQQAFKLAHWMHSNAISGSSRIEFFDFIENAVRKPALSQLGHGKSSFPILQVAYEKRIPFYHIGRGRYQLGWGSNCRWVSRSSIDSDAAVGMMTSSNKLLTATMLRSAGLPAPLHETASNADEAAKIASRLGWPVVIKPVDGERGEGVTVNINSETKIRGALELALRHSRQKLVLVEKQVNGVCHRLFLADDKLLYAVKRWPMAVFGNDKDTVAQLVDKEVDYNRTLPPWIRSEITPLDPLAMDTLAAQHLTPDSVPAQGHMVTLRPIESTAWGGFDEEVTRSIHPDNLLAAITAARLFRLTVAGIDIISDDITVPWYENGAIINEVNFSPLLGGGDISRRYLSEYLDRFISDNGRIPVEVFIGGPNAWKAGLNRQREMTDNSIEAHLTSHDKTLYPNGAERVVPEKNLSSRLLSLMLDREVKAIVFVIQTDEPLYTDLPVDWVDRVNTIDSSLVSARNLEKTLHPQSAALVSERMNILQQKPHIQAR